MSNTSNNLLFKAYPPPAEDSLWLENSCQRHVPRWRGKQGVEITPDIINFPMQKAGSHNNWHYNPKLQPYANELRKNMTKAETALWKQVLKAKSLEGIGFRRQRPILDYIVDFMSKELMLVIEVDGDYHDWGYVGEKDLERRKQLEEVGFTLVRFRNKEILNDLESVRIYLEQWIEDWRKKSTP